MIEDAIKSRLTPNVAMAAAIGLGVCVGLCAFIVPDWRLENMVEHSGIAVFIPAAEPPLGMTARACVGLFTGGIMALVAWICLSALMMANARRDRRRSLWDAPLDGAHEQVVDIGHGEVHVVERRPLVRRADAHPDARPREPLRARDLAVPSRYHDGEILELANPIAEPAARTSVSDAQWYEVPEDQAADGDRDIPVPEIRELVDESLPPEPVIAMGAPVEGRSIHAALPDVQDLPADLDQPLAAFDPAAIPEEPRPAVRPTRPAAVAPVEAVPAEAATNSADAGRIETFELPVPKVEAATAPATEADAPRVRSTITPFVPPARPLPRPTSVANPAQLYPMVTPSVPSRPEPAQFNIAAEVPAPAIEVAPAAVAAAIPAPAPNPAPVAAVQAPVSAPEPGPRPSVASFASSAAVADQLLSRPITAPQTDASVHALLERLERGLAKLTPPVPPAPPPAAPAPQPQAAPMNVAGPVAEAASEDMPSEPPFMAAPEVKHAPGGAIHPDPQGDKPWSGLEDTLSELRRMAMRI